MAKLTLKKRCALFDGKKRKTDYNWDSGREFEDTVLLYTTSQRKLASGGITYTITIIDRNDGEELFKLNKIKKFDVDSNYIFLSRYNQLTTDLVQEAVIDLRGNYIIPFGRYPEISYIYNHFYVCSKEGFGLCDKNGVEKVEPKYSYIKIIDEYSWCFFNKEDLKGIYFSVNGRCIQPVFKQLYYYDQPKVLIGVTENNGKIVYDVKKGKEILAPNIKSLCEYYERKYMLTNEF